ncbi:hypothetical protein [Alkalihalobacillus sp. AL-G]|uniref:hypothetical protein n=1 Tax=Alkalihalobacillus sp. AL-G TaxID=2926399 RepID=UPI00272DA302|nr:hypothetical protein [Alkalihalobacillus sp. AL-G]WLD91506.1 hypothetical protein MOJ78_10635 [Alkalihalobacillus sp. AL-G]
MKNNNAVKAIFALVIVVVFFLISENFQEKERASLAVDSEKFNVVDTKEELEEKLMRGVPFYNPEDLKMIKKYKLMTELEDMVVPVLEENRTIRLEKVWEENFGFIVTYSLNLLPEDKGPESIPYLTMDRISLKAEGKDPLELGIEMRSDSEYEWVNRGIVFEDRIYRTIWVETNGNGQIFETLNKWVEEDEALKSMDDAIHTIDQVSFEDIELVHIGENSSRKKTQIQNLTFNMQLGKSNQVLQSIKLNKTVDLGNGIQVLYKRLDMRLRHSQMYLEFVNQHPPFSEITFKMNDYEHGGGFGTDEDGEVSLYLPNMHELLGNEFDLQLISGIVPANNEVKFTITKKDLDGFKTLIEKDESNTLQIDRPVGKHGENEFFLSSLVRQPYDSIGFELGIRSEASHQRIWFRDYARHQEELEGIPEEHREHYLDSPFIEVTDDNGDPLMVTENHGSSSTSSMMTQYHGYNEEQFLQAEEIHVRLFNIPDQISFSENKIHIKLPAID